MIYKAYKVEIKINESQSNFFLRHSGTIRFVYNWALDQKKQALDAKLKLPNAIELHKKLVVLKQSEFAWMYEVSKCAPQEALRNLDKAFENFFKKRKRFPKFKSRKNQKTRCKFTGTIKVSVDEIQIPIIGRLKLKEKDYLPTDCKILSATVSEHAGKWFVSVLVEQEKPQCNQPKHQHDVVGIDLGIKTLATISDGQIFENPKPLKKNLKKLRRLQRSISRKVKGSNNRRKATQKVTKLHYKISNIRKDNLHKVTTALAKTKRVIVIEDLNVSGMLKNRKLSRAISDLGLFEIRRQLTYKGDWYNCQVHVVDRFFPSSKMCHVCKTINSNLTLSDRDWVCDYCGEVHDRDFNASKNLELVAVGLTET